MCNTERTSNRGSFDDSNRRNINPPAAPCAENHADSPESRPLTYSLPLTQLKALVQYTDPCSHNDDRDLVPKGIYHETDGSDDGLAIADEWSSHADDYPGPDEIARRWHSLKDDTGDPVTVCTLCDMVEANGFDWMDICSSTEPDFEPCNSTIIDPGEQPAETPPAPPLPLDQYSLKGLRSQLKHDAVRQVYALEPVALMGQATAAFGAPGTGKTLLMQYLAGNAILQGNVDPSKLYYFNADDSHAGLLEKLEYAEKFGYHTIAEGHQGFSTGRFLTILDDLTASNLAHGVILILDTGKKFFDPMSKRQGRAFGKHVRLFVLKGGTIIVLAHTNKYSDSEGKPIYAGTSDMIEDFDCAYLMYEVAIDADTATKTIQFENIKSRGSVARQANYRYSIAEGLSYREILESIEPVDATELPSLRQAAEFKSNARVIDAITACISDGINSKMLLAENAAERSGISKRAALKIIEKYTGSDATVHRWNYDLHERGAKKYRLLDPITADTDSAS